MEDSKLISFIRNHDFENDLPPLLFSFHSTEFYIAQKIFERGKLETHLCPIFNENLLYFFYGKPAYCVGTNRKYRTDSFYFPVAFVVDTNKISLDKIFPFDTGGYSTGLYSDYFHEKMDISDYTLGHEVQSIQKYIHAFFETNINYIKGKPNKNIRDNTMEIEALISLLNANGEHRFDERSYTVEIISKTDINITEAISAVIIPEDMMDAEYFENFKRNERTKIITYGTRSNTAPQNYNPVVVDKAIEYMKREGLINCRKKSFTYTAL